MVIIAVRDYRLHEPDPLIGVAVLPLQKLLKDRSQVSDALPLVGGVGYGRVRFAIGFRSVQAKLPRALLGWDVGTLEVRQDIAVSSPSMAGELQSCKMIVRTLYGKDKLRLSSSESSESKWTQKRGRLIHLPIKKRYSSCLLILFKKKVLGPDHVPAFSTVWLKDIVDSEETNLTLPIHRNTDYALVHAQDNAVQDVGEQVGELKLAMKFWPGLSGYHQNLSDADRNMEDVMEVLDCAEGSAEVSENDIKYTSDPDSSDESDTQESGLKGEFMNYRKQKGELRRKHRGLMQWRVARHFAWIERGLENKVDEVKTKVVGPLKHREVDGGLEKEA